MDKLFTAHFSFRFDSYRQCLCFSVEALTRDTRGQKLGERDRERGITRGKRGLQEKKTEDCRKKNRGEKKATNGREQETQTRKKTGGEHEKTRGKRQN